VSAESSERNGRASARLQERALADLVQLKDRALDVAAEGITIADARLPDRPLIYANEGFERVTGYPVADVLGRNCRFLQGSGSDPAAVAEIRAALAEGRECIVEILNYRRDGTTFWNRLSLTPVHNDQGELTHYIGVQSDVSARREAEHGLRRAKEALEHDLQLAARVQQALLPPAELHLGGLRIARAFHPCTDLAGDAVGVVAFPHGPVGLYLLDVSGHGVGAALLSVTLNHMLSPSVEGALLIEATADGPSVVSPSRVAERLNRQFPMDRTRQYFTFVYGVFEPSRGRLRYVMAGHPAPIVLPRTGTPAPLQGGGLPIGMIEHATFVDETVNLLPGDRLYFYTDGVIEALDASEQEFGFERLMAEIDRQRDRPLHAGLDVIADLVRDWSGGQLRDDVSLLAIECLP
jgi:sigma-B regulation protein RsbU (phosphoserine phosphatase)